MKTAQTIRTVSVVLNMALFGLLCSAIHADQTSDPRPGIGIALPASASMANAGSLGSYAPRAPKAHNSFHLSGDQLTTHLLYAPSQTCDAISSLFNVAPPMATHLSPVAESLVASSDDVNSTTSPAPVGSQPKTAAAQLTPTKQVLATVNYTQSAPATLSTPGAAQIATGLTVSPTKALQLQTQWAENTGTSENQSASISMSAKPSSTSQLNASYATTSASATSTQVINLAAKVAPTKTLAVDAGADEMHQAGDSTDQQHVTVSLTPQKEVQLHTAVTMCETNQSSTTSVNVGAAVQPSSFVQLSADYTGRSAASTDSALSDALDTSTAKIALVPTKGVRLTGRLCAKPGCRRRIAAATRTAWLRAGNKPRRCQSERRLRLVAPLR